MPLKVEISHEFPFGVESYLEIFFDPAFADFVRERASVEEYRVESLERSETHIARTVKVVPKVELPGWMRRVLRSGRIAYLETMSHRIGSDQIRQTILSSVLPERIHIGALITLEALGPDRCRRRGEVDISVKIYGVGPRVEEQLAETFKKGYDEGLGHMTGFHGRAGV